MLSLRRSAVTITGSSADSAAVELLAAARSAAQIAAAKNAISPCTLCASGFLRIVHPIWCCGWIRQRREREGAIPMPGRKLRCGVVFGHVHAIREHQPAR